MNLLAKRENEVPAELEKVFPGVDELVRSFFGKFIEPGSGLLRSSVFDSRWETEVKDDAVKVRIACPGCRKYFMRLKNNTDICSGCTIGAGAVVSTLFALIIGFGAYFVGALYKYYEVDITFFLNSKGISPAVTDYYIPVMLYKVIPTGLIGIIAVLIYTDVYLPETPSYANIIVIVI